MSRTLVVSRYTTARMRRKCSGCMAVRRGRRRRKPERGREPAVGRASLLAQSQRLGRSPTGMPRLGPSLPRTPPLMSPSSTSCDAFSIMGRTHGSDDRPYPPPRRSAAAHRRPRSTGPGHTGLDSCIDAELIPELGRCHQPAPAADDPARGPTQCCGLRRGRAAHPSSAAELDGPIPLA